MVVHLCHVVDALVWLAFLGHFKHLEPQQIILLLNRVEFLILLAPLRLLLQHRLESLPQDLVVVGKAALVSLSVYELILNLCLLRCLRTQIVLGSNLCIVLERLHNYRMVLLLSLLLGQ